MACSHANVLGARGCCLHIVSSASALESCTSTWELAAGWGQAAGWSVWKQITRTNFMTHTLPALWSSIKEGRKQNTCLICFPSNQFRPIKHDEKISGAALVERWKLYMHKTSTCTLHASLSCLYFSENREIAVWLSDVPKIPKEKWHNLNENTLSTTLFQKGLLLEPSEGPRCCCGEAPCSIGLDDLALRFTTAGRPSSRKSPKAFVAGHKKSAWVSAHNARIFHYWLQMCGANICFMPLHVKLPHSKGLPFKPGLRRRVQTPSVYTGGPSQASPSTVFFGPVIYYKVLIGVYLFATASPSWSLRLLNSLAQAFPRLQLWGENYPPELLFVLPLFLSHWALCDFSPHSAQR